MFTFLEIDILFNYNTLYLDAMKIILISGTPGCGKTSVSKLISEKIDCTTISLNELVISKKFTIDYDKTRETYIADFKKLIPYVKKLIKSYKKQGLKYLIIEGHFSDIIPKKYIDYIIILRCHPDKLHQRLKERGYKESKILENLQSEILGDSANYFMQKKIKLPIYEVDTSNITIATTVEIIINLIFNRIADNNYIIGKVDWLERLSENNRLSEFFD